MAIHPSAEIHKTSEIADSAEIGPRVYIGPHCKIGENVQIGVNAVIECYTEIDEGTVLSPNAHVGGAPQDYSFNNEDTKLIIGKNCIIRESAPIHRGSTKDDWKTVIGDNCMIMALSHVAHDCKIGNNVTVVGGTLIPGHVHVDDFALLSGYSGIHQGVRIGKMAMTAAFSHTSLDVPPYCIIGNAVKGRLIGLNIVGMKRRGVSSQSILILKKALKIFLNKKYTLTDAKKQLVELQTESPCAELDTFVDFILEESVRGITRS